MEDLIPVRWLWDQCQIILRYTFCNAVHLMLLYAMYISIP